ncbi:uncharacterized protein LOC135396951 [Ornithodoros turicata]|uniref:uncharacterized protein LOC135383568 n=1 Tax=Ornithodoros turicata TaxID=34597 RepID=UPI003138E9E4
MNFIVVYLGGNDIDSGREPHDVVNHLLEFAHFLQGSFENVFLCQLMPRLDDALCQKHKRFNRRLKKAADRTIHIVGTEFKFLKHGLADKRLLAADGYHVDRKHGINALAFCIQRALHTAIGTPLTPAPPHLTPRILRCTRCATCGKTGARKLTCGHGEGICGAFRAH